MKKKILALAIAAIMVVTALASISLAYLMDTDSAVNTMAVGNVKIEQTEWERTFDEDGEFTGFQEFAQDKKLVPGVYIDGHEANWKTYYNNTEATVGKTQLNIADGQAWNGFWGNSKQGLEWNGSTSKDTYNAQDKIVVVKNTGSESAYYRTIILIEDFTGNIIMNKNGNSLFAWNYANGSNDPLMTVTIEGIDYLVFLATYTAELAPDEVSRPSMLQLMLDKATTNEQINEFAGKVDVFCLSQAVQSAGFEAIGASAALDEAFGEVTAENIADWFAEIDMTAAAHNSPVSQN